MNKEHEQKFIWYRQIRYQKMLMEKSNSSYNKNRRTPSSQIMKEELKKMHQLAN